MFISRYDHFYCCFIKWSVNFLLIRCFVIKGLYLYPYLFPEDGILKFIKYHLSLMTGANPISCSFFLSKWWTFELKRCKCSHLAQKVADIYEHVHIIRPRQSCYLRFLTHKITYASGISCKSESLSVTSTPDLLILIFFLILVTATPPSFIEVSTLDDDWTSLSLKWMNLSEHT